MNIFDDIIEELKQEHLLERSAAETNFADGKAQAFEDIIEAETFLSKYDADSEKKPKKAAATDVPFGEKENLIFAGNKSAGYSKLFASKTIFSGVSENKFPQKNQTASSKILIKKADLYRQRAIGEVSDLQMVELVLTGIEREQLKIVPHSFADLNVKKALHSFLQISAQVNSPEHAEAEFDLMQETEIWRSALARRDENVLAAHLRRYCETTQPVLSSQALIALTRFYRNIPYSESARNKFDFVISRLFSKEVGCYKRGVVLKRNELVKQIADLYSEWSNLFYGSNDEDDSPLSLIASKFADFKAEADNAKNFDELIRSDFFNRFRTFKTDAGERFFAPSVTAAAIESNVRIGNRYVELLENARIKGETEKIKKGYGLLDEQVIFDATGKTVELLEILRERKAEKGEKWAEKRKAATKSDSAEPKETKENEEIRKKEESKENKEIAEKNKSKKTLKNSKSEKRNSFAFDKRLAILTVFVLLGSLMIYWWANSYDEPYAARSDTTKINLNDFSVNQYIKNTRVNREILFAVAQPSWNKLQREEKEEILKKVLSFGKDNKYTGVSLQSETGETVGSATAKKVDVY